MGRVDLGVLGSDGSAGGPGGSGLVGSPPAYSRAAYNGSYWISEIPDAVDICAEFGVSTGATDNSTAINNALATLGPLGLRALITKPGVYAIQNPIIIGNGTSSTLSTWTARLEGIGNPSWLGQFQGPCVQIKWTGPTGGTMVQVLGPVSAPGLKSLYLNGNSLAAIPIHCIASQFGEYEQIMTAGCYNGIVCEPLVPFSGYITNHQHNRWRQIGVNMTGYPNTSPSSKNAGVYLGSGSSGATTADCCFDHWEDLWISVPNTSSGNTLSAIYLGGSDTNWIRNVHPLYVGGGSDAQYSITFDFTEANGAWPEGNIVEGINLQKAYRNIAGSTGTQTNYVVGISGANGGVPAKAGGFYVYYGKNGGWTQNDRQQSQTGLIVPSDNGWTPASQVAVANQAYIARFVPDYDMSVIEVAINVTTAATSNDAIDVGFYNSAGTKQSSTGSTTSIVNVAGVRTISINQSFVGGQVYYLAIAYGTVGGTAATIQMANTGATNTSALFGSSMPAMRLGQQATAFPLPSTISPTVNSIGAMAAVRSS